jgi:uncharacterized protein YjbJ (UPF0337 family)
MKRLSTGIAPPVYTKRMGAGHMSGGHITQGKWDQIKGSVKERWGELTDDEYQQSEGKLDQLAGKIEEKYGHARAEVMEQLDKLTSDERSEDNHN